MYFDNVFPDILPGHTPADDNELLKDNYIARSILKTSIEDKCCVCDKICTWLDIDFIGMICSEECLNKIIEEYNKAAKKSDKRNRKWYRRLFWFIVNKYLNWRYR